MTGLNSPFPWFYPVFFTGMIIHRAIRDIQRCRRKYGKAWEQYEREVPYLFIPVSSHPDISIQFHIDIILIAGNSMLSERPEPAFIIAFEE